MPRALWAAWAAAACAVVDSVVSAASAARVNVQTRVIASVIAIETADHLRFLTGKPACLALLPSTMPPVERNMPECSFLQAKEM
ncbi:exported hypothetical protein [Parafrankia sp. Ea1.12]|nr:exported hypothetical protein [Parafrankia sp. Ea1.12]